MSEKLDFPTRGLRCPDCDWALEVDEDDSLADGSDAQLEYRMHYRYDHFGIPEAIRV